MLKDREERWRARERHRERENGGSVAGGDRSGSQDAGRGEGDPGRSLELNEGTESALPPAALPGWGQR